MRLINSLLALLIICSFIACKKGTYPLGMNDEGDKIEYSKDLNTFPKQTTK